MLIDHSTLLRHPAPQAQTLTLSMYKVVDYRVINDIGGLVKVTRLKKILGGQIAAAPNNDVHYTLISLYHGYFDFTPVCMQVYTNFTLHTTLFQSQSAYCH